MKYKDIVHISYTSRKEGNLGGVEKFAWYLKRAIGCKLVTATQYQIFNPQALNARLMADGVVKPDTLCIVDGAWGLGLPRTQKLISVVHGSCKEFAIRNGRDSEGVGADQNEMWNRDGIYMVAVSQASAKYLRKHNGVNPHAIILNGVDTKLFKPKDINTNKGDIVIHCANDWNKDGGGKLGKIAEMLWEFRIELRYLDAKAGEETVKFQAGDMFLQCSNYEGNSYAAIEAMSCGLPVVATEAGLFEDTAGVKENCGIVVDWNSDAHKIASEILTLMLFRHEEPTRFTPRDWVVNNCSYEKFATEWKRFINERVL